MLIPPPPAKHAERERFFWEKSTDANLPGHLRGLSLHSRDRISFCRGSTDYENSGTLGGVEEATIGEISPSGLVPARQPRESLPGSVPQASQPGQILTDLGTAAEDAGTLPSDDTSPAVSPRSTKLVGAPQSPPDSCPPRSGPLAYDDSAGAPARAKVDASNPEGVPTASVEPDGTGWAVLGHRGVRGEAMASTSTSSAPPPPPHLHDFLRYDGGSMARLSASAAAASPLLGPRLP
ncbi:hypothetical protein E2562_006882 [Oryza meyeriana var. granulata]|uniref:Uncharacterized protein n=1 Tax=Oryza meyeriana var. granulata TaxID=110450 RepID=A0A6G1BJS3_9ORYZ|nr:hypothetical protein E2562_006882 [Oryza meyeriana var. granulata]